MATLIQLSELTSQIVTRSASGSIESITGLGIFDTLLAATSSFIELQEQNNKITQTQYAEAITQSIPVVLNASIDFLIKSLATAVQIDKTLEEVKLTYVSRVYKDKETALMGLDDVAIKARMLQNGTSVYVPSYNI